MFHFHSIDPSQKKQDTSDSQQDAYEDDQGPAIDDEEYLACIRKAMRLTLEMKSDGKDDIKDQNVVSCSNSKLNVPVQWIMFVLGWIYRRNFAETECGQ